MTFRVLNTSSSPDNGVFTVDVLEGNTANNRGLTERAERGWANL